MRLNRAHPLHLQINRFLYRPAYFLFIGGLTILSNVFCQELIVYTVLLATGIYICLFGRDLLPLFPIFAFGYISPSFGNNPGLNTDSVFSLKGGGLYLAVLLALLAVSLVYRLVTDPDFGGKKFLIKKRKLLPGMLLLSACYAISGLFSGQWAQYGWRNLLFAFLQLVAIAGLYYLLSGAVRWDLAPKAYLFWTGISLGYVLLVELLGIYIKADVIVDGSIVRERIATGWGHYNSMGALFTMVIPLSFFLTGKGRYASFAYMSAFLFCLGLLFTCSRGSIVFGVVVYGAGYIVSLVNSRHARSLIWVHSFIVSLPVLAIVFFSKELLQLFGVLVEIGFDSAARLTTYIEGLKQFLKFPVFGGSFFPVDFWPYAWASAPGFASLFPPRWHNTLVQLLATGGLSCLIGYGIHRVQTLRLFVRDFSTEKLFAGLSILALLMTSMVDCHFFNVGPVLFYSGTLAIVEFQLNKSTKNESKH